LNAETKNVDTGFWDEKRGIIRSRNGGWIMGTGVFCHGYNMMEELVGKISYGQFVVLNATGRLPEKNVAAWVEATYICMSWPDPRIWCNQVGALSGSLRTSVIAATAAGVQTAFSRVYGPNTLIEGVEFIQRAVKKFNNGSTVGEIIAQESSLPGGKPVIMGFARPVAKGDERIVAMEQLSEELGFHHGEHLSLAYEIEKQLMTEYDEGLNLTGYMAAFLADQGFSPDEACRLCAAIVASGVTACYVDTCEKPPESFLPMRCNDIDYQGKPPRPVPDK